MLEEARASVNPFSALVQPLAANTAANLRDIARMDPDTSAEDAVLALVVLLALTAALGARGLGPESRRLAGATT